MCFSATASFTAAGLLSFIGARSVHLASAKQKAYATIPLLFALQQTSEGLNWLAGTPHGMLAQAYLFFAFVCWPIWVPFAIRSMEPNDRRSYLLKGLSMIGYLLGIGAAVLIFCFPVETQVVNHSIAYHLALPPWCIMPLLGVYLLPVVGPWFVSSYRILNLLGAVGLAAMIISYWFWETTFTSVWCFFAALISTCIWLTLEFNLITGTKSR